VTRRLLRKDSRRDTTTFGKVNTLAAAPAEVNTTHAPMPKIYLTTVNDLATSNTTPPFPPRTTRQLKFTVTAFAAIIVVYEDAP
jgi:hypothetical protein